MSDSPSHEEIVALQQTLYTSKNPTRRWLHVTRRDKIEAWIAEAGPGGTALEVGPGSGVYLPTLAEHFESVTATDIQEAHLDDLRPRFPDVRIVADDITASRLEAGGFDLILCSEVIEHIPDSAPALTEMARLLKPSGTLLLSTPQRYSPLELTSKIAFLPGIVSLVRRVYREPVLKQGHINLMTRRTVLDQVRAAGLEVEEEFFSGVYVPLMAEFTGRAGLAVAESLERWWRRSILRPLLWTQYYRLRKPAAT